MVPLDDAYRVVSAVGDVEFSFPGSAGSIPSSLVDWSTCRGTDAPFTRGLARLRQGRNVVLHYSGPLTFLRCK